MTVTPQPPYYLTDEEYVRHLRSLADRYPSPVLEEVLRRWKPEPSPAPTRVKLVHVGCPACGHEVAVEIEANAKGEFYGRGKL